MLAALIKYTPGEKGGLSQVLDGHQRNLSKQISWIEHLALVRNINEGKDWKELLEALELNGHRLVIVVEQDRGGSEEILFPSKEDTTNADLGAAQLNWAYKQLRMQARLEAQRKKMAQGR